MIHFVNLGGTIDTLHPTTEMMVGVLGIRGDRQAMLILLIIAPIVALIGTDTILAIGTVTTMQVLPAQAAEKRTIDIPVTAIQSMGGERLQLLQQVEGQVLQW